MIVEEKEKERYLDQERKNAEWASIDEKQRANANEKKRDREREKQDEDEEEGGGRRRRCRTSKRESVDPINQSLMVSDVFLFVRLDEPIHKRTHMP